MAFHGRPLGIIDTWFASSLGADEQPLALVRKIIKVIPPKYNDFAEWQENSLIILVYLRRSAADYIAGPRRRLCFTLTYKHRGRYCGDRADASICVTPKGRGRTRGLSATVHHWR